MVTTLLLIRGHGYMIFIYLFIYLPSMIFLKSERTQGTKSFMFKYNKYAGSELLLSYDQCSLDK